MIAWPRMVRMFVHIAVFPLAALVMGALWQAVHPAGFWSLRAATEKPRDGFARVTWNEARPRVKSGQWLLIDARSEAQFNTSHLPGAVSLPANSFPEALEFFAAEHGTNRPAVIYCDSAGCDVSAELAARLRRELGWLEVRILEGGFLEWRRKQP